jgi:hypothetical protein
VRFDLDQAMDVLERTDCVPRAETILEKSEGGTFEPFDRFARIR